MVAPSGPTRVTHQVRCRSKTNPQLFVDVEVLDAVCFATPQGDTIMFGLSDNIPGVKIAPYIIDKTGDGNGKGILQTCSRLSHMERMTSQSDPTQFIDVEIIDAFALQPPQIESGNGPDETNDDQSPGGLVDSGDWLGAQHLFVCLSTEAVTNIVDNTGLGLTNNLNPSTITRTAHVNVVTNAGDTDDGTEFSDGIQDSEPPTKHSYVATLVTDAINVGGANGNNITLLIPKSGQDDIDATKYTTDPYTGETHAPPDNTDPNIYVYVPDTSSGANLGTNPTSAQTKKSGPINQGVFWWIKKINGIPNPWFWWCPVQAPLAYSYFGNPGDLGSWPWRGFVLWNNYPVIWILSENNPISAMGNFGSDSLDVAATSGNFLSGGQIINQVIWTGGEDAGSTFGPFGYLPVLEPPLAEDLFDSECANIWQLTGVTQTNLSNPNKEWNATSNPYLWPSSGVWEQVANTFADNWQTCAAAVIASFPTNGDSPSGWDGQPPGWNWQVPWYSLNGTTNYYSFQNGMQPFLQDIGNGFPPEDFVPATPATLNVSQLDAATWDTRPSLKFDQTGSGGPPVTWASESGNS